MKRIIILLAALLTAVSVSAKTPLVVSVEWLAANLTHPKLVLLHVGDKAGYDAAHIAGARLVSQSDVSVSDHSGKGLMLEMPPADDLRKRLEALGISDDSHVVVYYGNDWISPSTRILFTLDHAGLGNRSSLLDGGMSAWTRAGHPTVTEVPAARTGRLAPLKTRPILVDAAFVRSHLETKGFRIIDGRAAVFYDGVDSGNSHGTAHRTGHIANAASVPFSSVFGDDLKLLAADELKELFAKQGVKPGDTIVGYCHIGQQATAMLFAARSLGHPVLLYDGSFEDWSSKPDYPVEAPKANGGA